MRVSLLTGGDDPDYAIPLAESLGKQGIEVEFIGNDTMEAASGLKSASIKYFNLRGDQNPQAPLLLKIGRIVRYYKNLIFYVWRTDSRLFHILWLNKFECIDRTLMNILYKLKRKKLVFTAHNVNSKKRDGLDTWANRATLRAMYSMLDHIFVHTESAKEELVLEHGVVPDRITVIPFGLNTYAPDTLVSKREARSRLHLDEKATVLLFFGQIAPYKGLDVLLDALSLGAAEDENLRLIIAGKAKRGFEAYWRALKSSLAGHPMRARIVVNDNFIPDSDVPVLFRAADALILPYRAIYQSGPLSLAFRFGVPVVATRVGSFNGDVISGITGFLCEPDHPQDLARAIRQYSRSELHLDGDRARQRIRQIGSDKYSWEGISRIIAEVYTRLEKGAVAC
jgi:D-inositol-3-phosphate glycosyltransferase